VREDYSPDGTAWDSFPHDQARSRAYRWGEDGIAGISDNHGRLCFALALWNGRDPILKERLFGLTGTEGNHGEDVKEYYFYLDSTPTHSYMKFLYKYPQAEFPYTALVEENRRRDRRAPEFELIDTGVFEADRYFDVVVEYAKAAPDDVLIRITATNRGSEPAALELLPTVWYRNTWAWDVPATERPSLRAGEGTGHTVIEGDHATLGARWLYCEGAPELLFTDNDTNVQRLYEQPNARPWVKDGINDYVVGGRSDAVNPGRAGTKAAARYRATLAAGQSVVARLRLTNSPIPGGPFGGEFDTLFGRRAREADEFYETVIPAKLSDDGRSVMRQAFAGLLWSKQFYHYDVARWLAGDPTAPSVSIERMRGRNHEWRHLYNDDVISMPDKWEFPWFASWDLGFHCVSLAYLDPQLAKNQILLMLREWYMHPNGQLPAYEWDFDDVNPPILALAARTVFEIDRQQTGTADFSFMERVFQKMLLNFTWWVNRKDALGKNIFQGGFLGMDNIGVFDRDHLPPGYLLGQADGTSWMAAFAKSMCSAALLLAERDPVYEDLASKFWEHFIYIANAMNSLRDPKRSLWDERDGFFYDNLISHDRPPVAVRARTMVGFVPMFGATTVPANTFDRFPAFQRRRRWFAEQRPDLLDSVGPMIVPGPNNNLILGLVRTDQLRRMLSRMLDEEEFLSPYGVRAVSRYHRDHPLILNLDGKEYRLDYEPGESTIALFGGNSNWRGPIWMPVNFLIIAALQEYHKYYGDTFQVECPTGSGNMKNLGEVAEDLAHRLARIFHRDGEGRRPVFGDCRLFDTDPYWRDLIPFHEYFHGDSGRGCGASHQTGWTGLITQILLTMRGAHTTEADADTTLVHASVGA